CKVSTARFLAPGWTILPAVRYDTMKLAQHRPIAEPRRAEPRGTAPPPTDPRPRSRPAPGRGGGTRPHVAGPGGVPAARGKPIPRAAGADRVGRHPAGSAVRAAPLAIRHRGHGTGCGRLSTPIPLSRLRRDWPPLRLEVARLSGRPRAAAH